MAYQVRNPRSRKARLLTTSRRDDMDDLRCMSFTSKGTAEIIVAGLQDTMLVIDLIKGDVVKQVGRKSVPIQCVGLT